MEVLVAGALGIVIYCGYLTIGETLEDLRHEGLLKSFSDWCKQTVRRFVRSGGNLSPGKLVDKTFDILPGRVLVPVKVRRDPDRFYLGHF